MGSLDKSPGTNWVQDTGGLPAYIEKIAKSLHEKRGFTISRAIATAVSMCKRWSAGGEDVNADTRAKAAAAIAEWNAKRAAARGRAVDLSHTDALDHVDLSAVDAELETLDLAYGDHKPPYDWKHGYKPISPQAMRVKAKKEKSPNSGKRRRVAGEAPSKGRTPAQAKAADDEQRGRGMVGADTGPKPAPAKVETPDYSTTRDATLSQRISSLERAITRTPQEDADLKEAKAEQKRRASGPDRNGPGATRQDRPGGNDPVGSQDGPSSPVRRASGAATTGDPRSPERQASDRERMVRALTDAELRAEINRKRARPETKRAAQIELKRRNDLASEQARENGRRRVEQQQRSREAQTKSDAARAARPPESRDAAMRRQSAEQDRAQQRDRSERAQQQRDRQARGPAIDTSPEGLERRRAVAEADSKRTKARAQADYEARYVEARRESRREGATMAERGEAQRKAAAIEKQARQNGIELDEIGLDERARRENGPSAPDAPSGRDPRATGSITPATAGRMSDAQLEQTLDRLAEAGDFSSPAFKAVEAEQRKREDAKAAARSAEGNGRRR